MIPFSLFRTQNGTCVTDDIPNVARKLRQISEEIHRCLIRLIDLADAQHQERIGVLRSIVRELEQAKLLGDQ